MDNISVGVCFDGTIDIDFSGSEDDDGGTSWNFNNLTLAEAQFLHEELAHAITRARLRLPSPLPAPSLAPVSPPPDGPPKGEDSD